MKKMTEGNEARLILSFSIPLLLGNVFQQLYSTVDAIVVGFGVGKAALAAIGVSFPIIFLMISIVAGICMGTGILLSQYYGAGDTVRLRKAMHTSYVFLFYASIVATVAGIFLADPVLRLIGTPADTIDDARLFLQITFASMVFVFGYNATTSVMRSLGDSKNPLYFIAISSLLNVALDILFVLGFGWGIAGAAWATFISQAVAFFISLVFLQRSKHTVFRISWKELRIDRIELSKILRLSTPTALQMGLVSLSFIAMTGLITPFGTDVIAGYTMASRLDSFAVLPAMTLSIAISTFVGQNMGANKPERVRKGLNATLAIGIGISVAISLLFIFVPRQLLGLFLNDQTVINYGAEYLVIVSSFYALFAAMFTLTGVLRGAGAVGFSMIATVVAVWVARIPASWILSSFIGPAGIWWGIPIGWLVGLAMVLAYYLSGRWKRFNLTGKSELNTLQVEPQANPQTVDPFV